MKSAVISSNRKIANNRFGSRVVEKHLDLRQQNYKTWLENDFSLENKSELGGLFIEINGFITKDIP